MNRRQFLVGTAAGLVLPAYYDKARSFFANHGEPLLQLPKRPSQTLYAVDLHGNRQSGFELLLDSPETEIPSMTLGDFIKHHHNGDAEDYLYSWDEVYEDTIDAQIAALNLEQEMDPEIVQDSLPRSYWPEGQAYEYLHYLDLGPELEGARVGGELQFIDGAGPGNDYLGVHAANAVTLTLLQQRLNVLNQNVQIKLT
jgi:hypothetical protein